MDLLHRSKDYTVSKVVVGAIIALLVAVGSYAAFYSFNITPATSSSTSQSTSSSTVPTTSSSGTTTTSTSMTTTQTSSSTTTSSSINTTTTSRRSNYLLKIDAQFSNGTSVGGMSVQISSGSNTINSTTIPSSFILPSGQTYNVTVGNGYGIFFDHWNTGVHSPSIIVQLNSNTSLTANYKKAGLQTVSVVGEDTSGRTAAGTVVNFYRNGHVNGSDIIPANFTANYGDQVSVVVYGASSLFFVDFNNNQSLWRNSYNFTVLDNTSVTAIYRPGPIPNTHPGKGNFTITVISHTLDGGELVGSYFQIRLNAVWNHFIDGFTPASVQVPLNLTTAELVMYHCTRVAPCYQRFFVFRYYNDSAHTLTRWNYITPVSGTVVMNSFYDIMPASQTIYVTVNGVNATFPYHNLYNCTCGALITIYHNGAALSQSLTPYSFYLWKGQQYTINLGPISGYTFVSWDNGITSTNRTLVTAPMYQDTNNTNLWDEYIFGYFQKNSASPSSSLVSPAALIAVVSSVSVTGGLVRGYTKISAKDPARMNWR